jgi:predicted TIM-barrel fold metal-dependent hydrolase
MPRAIDVHIHPPPPGGSAGNAAMRQYFRSTVPHTTHEEMAAYYEEQDIFGVLLTIDNRSVSGSPPAASNDYMAELQNRYPDRFISFGSVDPWLGAAAVKEAERCVRELGLRGFKFHASSQRFFANDQRFYPLWEKISELGVPALFHSGMTGVGAGTPGGGGIKFEYCRPIPYMDDIAADFPELSIIMAHPAFPWVPEQLAILVHKPNVVMDLSGWSPRYFDPLLIQYANTITKTKVMFGSDYQMISPERWLRDFEEAPFSDEVRPLILIENAKRVLKLDL